MKITVNTINAKVWHDPKTNEDKKFQIIVYNGNEEASAWNDDFTNLAGKEVEVEITTTKTGKKTLKLVKTEAVLAAPAKSQTTPTPSSDVELRKSAVLLTEQRMQISGQTILSDGFWDQVLEMAKYLQDGTVPDKK